MEKAWGERGGARWLLISVATSWKFSNGGESNSGDGILIRQHPTTVREGSRDVCTPAAAAPIVRDTSRLATAGGESHVQSIRYSLTDSTQMFFVRVIIMAATPNLTLRVAE